MSPWSHTCLLLAAAGLASCSHEAARAPASTTAPALQAASPASPPTDCAALQQAAPAGVVITAARVVEAAAERAGTLPIPAHCLVTAEFGTRIGVGGVRYATRFELRLPQAWNGRFQFMGGGGTDGSVRPAWGFASNGSPPALAAGYAVVSSDFGHQATDPRDASFGLDPQARTDWGYNSLIQVTHAAKAMVRTHYGRAPQYSYYAGCSGGGRQAMLAAQRLPQEYDGILAGAPILEQHVAQIGSMQILQEFTRIAPLGADGKPVLSGAFSDGDLRLIQQDVLAQCDALDGVADSSVDHPAACAYSPAALTCAAGKTDRCLSAAQVGALQRVLAGPRDGKGKSLYEPYPIDAGVIQWRGAMLGTSASATPNAARATNTSVKYVFMTPPDPAFDYLKFDFDTDPARLAASAAFTASNSIDLQAFKAKGGKAIVYMGTGDALLNANGVRRWYEKLLGAQGGVAGTHGFARYFQVPGMGHCGGGPSLDRFDPFAALVDWVERSKAPNQLLATGSAFPGRTRPLCPHPQVPRYLAGDTNQASNFRCE
jgi:Tannase and feruloyl esterase